MSALLRCARPIWCALSLLSACARPVEGDVDRGAQLFLDGKRPNGAALDVVLDVSNVSTDANDADDAEDALVPQSGRWACSRCHGDDARGAREGGVSIPPLGPDVATRSLDELARMLRSGQRPDGTKLSVAMPRFKLSDGDIADLVAFLRAPPAVGRGAVLVLLPADEQDARRTRRLFESAWSARDPARFTGVPFEPGFVAPLVSGHHAIPTSLLLRSSPLRAVIVSPGAVIHPAQLSALDDAGIAVLAAALDVSDVGSAFSLGPGSGGPCEVRGDALVVERLIEVFIEALCRAGGVSRAAVLAGFEQVVLPPRDGLPAVRFGRRIRHGCISTP